MGRRKKETVDVEPDTVKSGDNTTAKELQDSFKAFLGKQYEVEQTAQNKIVIPTGLDVLDAISGGGIGMNFVQFVGNPGSAKSTLAAKILAEGQKRNSPKFLSVYLDSEQSTNKDRLMQLGVNQPPITPYDQRVSVEKVFKTVDGMCKFKQDHKELMDVPSMIIWDSIANTLTEKAFDAERPEEVIGQKARVLSQVLPRITDTLNRYNISLVGVNQLREKIDMGIFKTANDLKYLGNNVIPGGKSLLFNSFQLYFLQHIKDVDSYGFQGAVIKCKTVKNKLFTPNLTVSLIMSFQRGFSNFWTNYEFLKETKRVKIGGAWATLEAYPTKKFQQKNALSMYRENSAFREAWDESVKEAIKSEIIEPNKSVSEDMIESIGELSDTETDVNTDKSDVPKEELSFLD